MKKAFGFGKAAAAVGLCVSLLAVASPVSAAMVGPENERYFGNGGPAAGGPGGQMVISEPGEYTLTGDMRGTVMVDPGAGDVHLILDGTRLDGANGPAIMAVSGDSLSIEMAPGSRNELAGGPQGQFGGAGNEPRGSNGGASDNAAPTGPSGNQGGNPGNMEGGPGR